MFSDQCCCLACICHTPLRETGGRKRKWLMKFLCRDDSKKSCHGKHGENRCVPFVSFLQYIVINTANIPEETKLAKFYLSEITVHVGEGTCRSLSWITMCFLLYWNNEHYWINSCHVYWQLIIAMLPNQKVNSTNFDITSCHGQSCRRYANSCVMSPVALAAVAERWSPWLYLEPTVFSQILHRQKQNNHFGADKQKWFVHNHNVRCF